MCDFSGKLVAWMDRELPESEAADVEQHLAACAECREQLATFECASSAFNAYGEAVFAVETRCKLPRWLSAAGIAAGIAAAAAIAALLMLPRQHIANVPPRVPPPAAEVTPPANSAAAPLKRSQRQYAAAGLARNHKSQHTTTAGARGKASLARNVSPFPAEPPIQIAIAADAMFPPGAVPPGMSFTAELTISADGSAEQVGLRPHLAGFERRANQP